MISDPPVPRRWPDLFNTHLRSNATAERSTNRLRAIWMRKRSSMLHSRNGFGNRLDQRIRLSRVLIGVSIRSDNYGRKADDDLLGDQSRGPAHAAIGQRRDVDSAPFRSRNLLVANSDWKPRFRRLQRRLAILPEDGMKIRIVFYCWEQVFRRQLAGRHGGLGWCLLDCRLTFWQSCSDGIRLHQRISVS